MTKFSLTVKPLSALVDEPFSISISHAPKDEKIVLRMQIQDASGIEWAYQQNFTANHNGELWLDADDHATMHFISRLKPVHEANQYRPFKQPAIDESLLFHLTALVDGEIVAHVEIERRYLANTIQVDDVNENGLIGTLFRPMTAKPQPAIMLLGGSGGRQSIHQAALLARHGYVVLTLAYFNHDQLPPLMVEIPLEYFERGIHFLEDQPAVDSQRLAVWGKSRGGELALLLASTFQDFSAVIADVPSGVAWDGFGKNIAEGRKAAWTYQGQAVPFMNTPFVPEIYAYFEEYQANGIPISARQSYEENLRRFPEIAANAQIPVENICGHILMISGEDDQLWPSTPMADITMRRLEQHNFQYQAQHISYPHTGHQIPVPYLPCTTTAIKHPVAGSIYNHGGEPDHIFAASLDAWRQSLHFLEHYLKAN